MRSAGRKSATPPTRKARALSETDVASTLQQLIDDLPEQIALLDEECLIVAANEAWKNTAEEHGFPEVMPGHNYRDFCATRAVQGYEPAIEALAALDDFRAGKRSFWQLVYNGRDSWRGRDYQITLHRIWLGGRNLISVTRFDLTEILRLRRAKDDFTTSLIEGQAFERQRMGREIHDSTSQLLAAIGLILGRLRQQLPESEALGLVEEMQELLTDVHGEIRSISYLAHPPSLKKLGLADAVKSLVEGFGRRTGLETSFDIHGDSVPMSASAESMIYRLAQEALSNIYRHAHATRVRLQLRFRRSTAHFVVADDGIGISQETLAGLGGEGVGLASMRSRLAELGGRLSIRTLSPGVAIIASVPSP